MTDTTTQALIEQARDLANPARDFAGPYTFIPSATRDLLRALAARLEEAEGERDEAREIGHGWFKSFDNAHRELEAKVAEAEALNTKQGVAAFVREMERIKRRNEELEAKVRAGDALAEAVKAHREAEFGFRDALAAYRKAGAQD